MIASKISAMEALLYEKWLHKPYIMKWYNPEEWLEEIKLYKTKYDFIHHFIVEIEDSPIGFCQYYDYSKGGEDWHGSFNPDGFYSLDYLIGEEDFLGKGNGTQIVQLLTKEIADNTMAKGIIVQPEKGNLRSRKTLLSLMR